MSSVPLRTVTFRELSDLRHEVAIAESTSSPFPAYLVVRFFGPYREGDEGASDALYILAATTAAQNAWCARSTILDFRELAYSSGSNMHWVTELEWDASARLNQPLAIVVGERCRKAMQTLLREEYHRFCVESLEDAFFLCRPIAEKCKPKSLERANPPTALTDTTTR